MCNSHTQKDLQEVNNKSTDNTYLIMILSQLIRFFSVTHTYTFLTGEVHDKFLHIPDPIIDLLLLDFS